MIKPKQKLVSLTHIEDVDGIGSQAMLLRKFPNLTCFLSFYSNFTENIKKIHKLNPEKLYITDIGFNESYRQVFELLDEMNACWIDHHLISKEDESELKKHVKDFVHSTDETVAAELVQQLFLPDDEVSKKIARLAHFRDNSIDNEEADELQAIIELNQNDPQNIQRIVELLSKGDFQNNWFKEQFDIYKIKEMAEFKLLEERAVIEEVDGKKILISFSSFFATGKQTRYLLKKFDVDVVFGVNPKLKSVSIRTHDANAKKIAWEFGGGGHFVRAGFSYATPLDAEGKLSKNFIDDVKRAVKKALS